MKSIIKYPEKEYPYLAVFTMGESLNIHIIKKEDIVLISLVQVPEQDCKAYIQPLLGGKNGFFTTKESDYTPLPKGTEITFIQ